MDNYSALAFSVESVLIVIRSNLGAGGYRKKKYF